MTVGDPAHDAVGSLELIDELLSRATQSGANPGPWPGLTIYRFTEPTVLARDEIRGPSIGVVAQGRTAVIAGGRRYECGPSTVLVVGNGARFDGEIVDASAGRPCLCLVLRIEPVVVRSVSAEMDEHRHGAARDGGPFEPCVVSTLTDDLVGAVLRFLRALSDDADRRVLAPLYVREVVYRVLQRERLAHPWRFAARQDCRSPVVAALAYVDDHLSEPLTVAMLATHVNLSPSAFTRAFRALTGRAPYQYVKEARLERARALLLDSWHGVAEVSAAVGYASTSHFIKEFRRRFGDTPRSYADARSARRGLHSV